MTTQNSIEKKLNDLKNILKEAEKFKNAALSLETDIQTLCPTDAIEEEGEIAVFLENKEYLLRRTWEYTDDLLFLYEQKDELSEWDRALIESAFRQYLRESSITPEKAAEFSLIEKKAYASWSKAYDKGDFSEFKEALNAVIKGKTEKCALRSLTEEEEARFSCPYDLLLDEYERGFNVKTLDPLFKDCRTRLTSLIEKIGASEKRVRTDFLTRSVTVDDQMTVADKIASVLGFDTDRGTLTLAKHAFTSRLSKNDVRMTTYLDDFNFTSNIYTVLHESGHALFEQLQPGENFDYFLQDQKTQGMHESVSRFYENIIGRSEGFIHFIYPILRELLPLCLYDVTERELYEAVNIVKPTLIRTEADEVTYSLHIIIRYELEKELINGNLSIDDLKDAWNSKYKEYLGISPENDKEGVLQDVHWTSDFGYFPTYLLGNIYASMYYKTLCSEMDVDSLLREGKIEEITSWMKERVFKKADRLSPGEWIKDITGKDVTPDDYLEYLGDKYIKIYG